MAPRSQPDAHTCDLAARILAGGKARMTPHDMASYTDPDSLADALIEAGCKEVERADVAAHGRLARGSAGSEAQSVMERVAAGQQPEPRVAQLVRQRVHAEWMTEDPRLDRLADQVIELGLGGAEQAAAAAAVDPEAAAKQALDGARRQLAAAEGNHIAPGGDAAEVDAAFDTFDPPIRRHALADIVLAKLSQLGGQHKLGAAGLPAAGAGLATEL
ncbi:DEAD DEAH box helicase [Chlorella sorokiniana]|uniref:DEAD DEAH box helicase n=1 Tax=Chlorella sorokiniana TaxID=3076 RepID=A0A2P6TNZ2_CHLSO|nr:DEAD DEAH box helicase [Chlorella sorokiniana]|eukprot:PRW51048.1 DEAD DEAH box helicase [Chlorella sorokiniana]